MTPVAMTVSFNAPMLTVAVRRKSLFDSASLPGKAYNVAGEDRIGIGTDFTQGHSDPFFKWITQDKGYARTLTEFGEIKFPDGFSTIGDFPNLTAAMERAGWTEIRIRNILGLNWLRLLDEVWGP